jgi:Baseplate J-like protein
MSETLEGQINRILGGMDEQENQEPDTELPPEAPARSTRASDEIQDVYVLVVRDRGRATVEPRGAAIETTLAPENADTREPFDKGAIATGLFFLFLVFSCLALQLYLAFHPFIATVTIMAKSQQISLNGTLHLGRPFHPITLSQSQTVTTTGKGHQDATQAHGTITFYNGQFAGVTIAAGTLLTGASGVQVITDQDAVLPAGNPPTYGQARVAAHALVSGTRGNIPAYDINQACCAISVLAKNTQPWTGGQDERDFHTVAQSDIGRAVSPLKMTLAQSVSGAFQGQLKPNEQLYILPCTPTVLSDHLPGEEATQVHVTVSETCSAVSYDKDTLQAQATAFLSTQAATRLGTGYSLVGDVQVTVKQATVTPQNTPVVFSFNALGTWVYAVNSAEQQRIKSLIAGKTKQEAEQLLASMPGIEQASIRWGDETKLPKDTESIRVVGMYGI